MAQSVAFVQAGRDTLPYTHRMRKPWLGVCAVMAVTAVTWSGVSAQQAPDFSGAWIATKDAPTGVPAGPTAVFGPRFWIAQQASSITVTRPLRDTASVVTNKLDGTPSDTRLAGATCIGDPTITTSVTLTGGELAYTLVSQLPAGAPTPIASGVKHLFRLIAPDTLQVETFIRANAQAEPTKIATIYKKSTDPLPSIQAPPVKVAAASLSQMTWLAGNWAGSNSTSTGEERWTPAVGGAMHGISRTLRGGNALTAFEFLCVAERHGGLVYTAMPNARTPATDFFLTAIDATSATFENPSHDFPKKIRYGIQPDGTLEAIVSGVEGSRPITLRFKKQQ